MEILGTKSGAVKVELAGVDAVKLMNVSLPGGVMDKLIAAD